MSSVDQYRRILGVSNTASLQQIKNAYRIKAKELHPDVNKRPNAHEEFVLLSEAYEYFISTKKRSNSRVRKPVVPHRVWKEQQHAQARERAKRHAKMKYEAYKKTDHYKNSQAALNVGKHVYFFASILIIFSPLWGWLLHKSTGLIWGFILTFLTTPLWSSIFTEKFNLSGKTFLQSLKLVLKTKTFWLIITTLISLFLFFQFTLYTDIKTINLLGIFAGIQAIFGLAYLLKTKMIVKHATAIFICIIPLVINLFFASNYLLSSEPYTEEYAFKIIKTTDARTQRSPNYDETGFIVLSGDAYKHEHWFRMYFDKDEYKGKNKIIFTFENGPFGFRVLKEYKFTK